jgi:AAA ATPase containing von Willebrand factor type A (vWA) domain
MAIRPDTDPKNASPRAGSPQGELEQYGVWVKAEPQDIVEDVSLPVENDLDFNLGGGSASIAEESFLSADEEKLLDSFDQELDVPGGSAASDESGPLPDIEDMPPLDEDILAPEPQAEEIRGFDANETIDIELEDKVRDSSFSSINPGVEIDMSSVEGLDGPKTSPASASDAIEDVSSEFLEDFSEPAAPSPQEDKAASGADFGSGIDDVTAEFLDINEAAPEPASAGESGGDFEPLDIDLHFDDSQVGQPQTLPESSPASTAAESGFEDVTEFDDFLGKAEPKSEAGFDDVSAVERDLASVEPAAPAAPVAAAAPAYVPQPQAAPAKPDLSTEILLKIADELSSIKGELVSLKSQLGDVMGSMEATPKKAQEETPAPQEEAEAKSSGFFDDEEDETIALTGDELDNILNTADFTTEEASETEAPAGLGAGGVDESFPPDSGAFLEGNLLPETGDYSALEAETPPEEPAPAAQQESVIEEAPAIEEVRLGAEDEGIGAFGEETIPSIDELGIDAEAGVTPITPAPDDTSYLETPELGESFSPGELGEEELSPEPLSDAPLVEPDLSDFDIGLEEFEQRPEVDEELPLASAEAAPDEAQIEELTLDIDAGADYARPADEAIADVEFVEPVAEVEEPDFSEINLHEEAKAEGGVEEGQGIEGLGDFGGADLLAEEKVPGLDEPFEMPEEPLASEPFATPAPSPAVAAPAPVAQAKGNDEDRLKSEIKSVLSYLDKLLDSLPEDKIEEFAHSKYFDTYKKLFEELGLV